jgi:hypothetical protein
MKYTDKISKHQQTSTIQTPFQKLLLKYPNMQSKDTIVGTNTWDVDNGYYLRQAGKDTYGKTSMDDISIENEKDYRNWESLPSGTVRGLGDYEKNKATSEIRQVKNSFPKKTSIFTTGGILYNKTNK